MINPLKFLLCSSTVIRKFHGQYIPSKIALSASTFIVARTEKEIESVTALYFSESVFLFKFVEKVTKKDKVLRT